MGLLGHSAGACSCRPSSPPLHFLCGQSWQAKKVEWPLKSPTVRQFCDGTFIFCREAVKEEDDDGRVIHFKSEDAMLFLKSINSKGILTGDDSANRLPAPYW